MTPTTKTLRYLQANGWIADECERRITPMLTRDLFGIADVIALQLDTELDDWGPAVLLVQATSKSNVSARVKKIADHPNTPRLREMGVQIQVYGWGKEDEPRIVNCS